MAAAAALTKTCRRPLRYNNPRFLFQNTDNHVTISFLRAVPFTILQHSSISRTFSSSSSHRTSSPSSSKNFQLTKDNKLSWNDYFALRRQRRIMERVFTIPSTLLGFGLSFAYVVTREVDTSLIFGQEPILVYGAGTILSGLTGLLLGPVIGSSVWKIFHRKEVVLMEQRDSEFYEHIKKNRADPSLHSIRNPAPDYYGEKIKSAAEYRAWLRKQREFVRKGTFHIGEKDST